VQILEQRPSERQLTQAPDDEHAERDCDDDIQARRHGHAEHHDERYRNRYHESSGLHEQRSEIARASPRVALAHAPAQEICGGNREHDRRGDPAGQGSKHG